MSFKSKVCKLHTSLLKTAKYSQDRQGEILKIENNVALTKWQRFFLEMLSIVLRVNLPIIWKSNFEDSKLICSEYFWTQLTIYISMSYNTFI